MDGITLRAVASDLEARILDARIEKIYQPEKDELIFSLRSGEKLLLSASASHARVHITEYPRTNPPQPPMFCMLLRKHLTGAKIVAIRQPGFERVLHIDFQAQDEMGFATVFTLICETMGKHSNLILVRENGLIVDAIKHVPPSVSSVRYVMPGLKYEMPPAQNKRNPLNDGKKEILSTLHDQVGRLETLILNHWAGFAPAFAREAALRCDAPTDWETLSNDKKETCAERLSVFFDMLREARFAPTIVVNMYQEAIACFPFVSVQYDPAFQKAYPDIHRALDAFYALRDNASRIKQKSAALHKLLTQHIERARKKLAIQHDILERSDKMERDRIYGELLTTYAHSIPKSATSAEVQNYYEEDAPTIAIPLDPSLSVIDNAQRYYKRYRKAKAAFDMAAGQIENIKKELSYLEGQLDDLQKCTQEPEIMQIREELIEQKYIRNRPSKQRKSTKIAPTKPLRYRSSTGLDIYVGKNNAQNDQLTMRFADPDDIWLHVKDIPGSHVLIKHGSPDDATLNEAAQLAVYYSKARQGSHVPVDYTPRKYIKKPNGSPPGYVIYSTNQTAYITPDEALIKSLQKTE